MKAKKPTRSTVASKAKSGQAAGTPGPKKAPAKAVNEAKAEKGSQKKLPSKATTPAAMTPPAAAAGGGPAPARDLKQRFAALASATGKISGLKRSLSKSFFDVGVILNQIRDEKLYEVKGYGSFEAFVEREIDINKLTCLRSARIAEAMIREVALEAGLDRSSAAVAALDGEDAADLSVRISGGNAMPLVPLHKQ